MFHDKLHSRITAEILLEPAAKITTTTESSACDLRGFGAVDVLFILGDSADILAANLSWTWSLEECATTDGSYTPVALADLIGVTTLAGCIANDEAEDSNVYRIGYKGSKRFIKGVMTAAGSTSSGIFCTIVAIKSQAAVEPTTEQAQP
jgi:hypothetical protein